MTNTEVWICAGIIAAWVIYSLARDMIRWHRRAPHRLPRHDCACTRCINPETLTFDEERELEYGDSNVPPWS
jgi:hypothetical protein